jgi:hypothetical protein
MSLVARIAALAGRLAAEIRDLVRPDDPGLARAWVNFGRIDGALLVRAASGVTSVTALGTGRYRINFLVPFADTHYCWVATARSATTIGPVRFVTARDTADTKTTSFLDLACVASTGSLADSEEINLVVYR